MAEPETSEDDIILLEVDIASLYNPLGISFSAEGFNRQVYRKDKSRLWDGLYYQTGAQALITPAFSRAGFHVEWMPITILQLRAQYDRLYFSGSFGSLLSFSSSDQLFGDDEIDARDGDERSGYASRSSVQMTLRAQFGRTIIRNVTDFVHYKFPGDGPYYLEREYELLMATTDDVLSNQLYLLFEDKNNSGSRLIGPYHDYVHVENSGLTRERAGITWYQQYNKAIGVLQKPRWYIQSGFYLQDPNRQDEFYLLFGIGGDFQI